MELMTSALVPPLSSNVMLRPKALLGIIPPHSSMPTHSLYGGVKSEGI